MIDQQARRALAAELPPHLQYVYNENPASTLPSQNQLALTRDRTKATGARIYGGSYMPGMLQHEEVVRHTLSLPFPPPHHEVTAADRDRLARFRMDSQRLIKNVPTEFIIAHAAITALPPSLRHAQIDHLLQVAQGDNPWTVRYIPHDIVLPPHGEGFFHITDMPEGSSVHIETYNYIHSSEGVVLELTDLNEQYLPPASPETVSYLESFAALGGIALDNQASMEALTRLQ